MESIWRFLPLRDKIFHGMIKYRLFALIVWGLTIVLLGCIGLPALAAHRRMDVHSKIDSLRAHYSHVPTSTIWGPLENAGFGDSVGTVEEAIVLRCKSCRNVVEGKEREKSEALKMLLDNFEEEKGQEVIFRQGNYFTHDFQGWGNRWLSGDLKSTVFVYKLHRYMHLEDTALELRERLEEFRADLEGTGMEMVGPTGWVSLLLDTTETTQQQMGFAHILFVLVTFAIFIGVIPSTRLLIICIICECIVVFCTLCVSTLIFEKGYFRHNYGSITFDVSVGLPMSLFTSFACVTDFLIFMFRVMIDEVSEGNPIDKAMETAWTKVGGLIFMSTVLLCIAWSAMLFLPMVSVSFAIVSLALAGLTSIVFSLLVTLTLGPCLVSYNPMANLPKFKWRGPTSRARDWKEQVLVGGVLSPISLLFLVLILVFNIDLLTINIPHGTQAEMGWSALKNTPGLNGRLQKLNVLVQHKGTVTDMGMLSDLCAIGKKIEDRTKGEPFQINRGNIVGLAFGSEGQRKCIHEIASHVPGGIETMMSKSEAFEYIYTEYKRFNAALLVIEPNFDLGNFGLTHSFVQRLREIIEDLEDLHPSSELHIQIGSEAIQLVESIEALFTKTPRILKYAVFAMLVFVAICLNATALMSVKMIVSTAVAVFGLLELSMAIYGIDDVMRIRPVQGPGSCLECHLPFTTMGVSLGLAVRICAPKLIHHYPVSQRPVVLGGIGDGSSRATRD